MNHDSTPTPAATQSGNENQNLSNSDPASDDQRHNGEASRARRRRRRSRRASSALSKKLEFMTHLLTNLDGLFFIEIGTLYYLESSFLRFLIRALAHYAFLTPKPESFPIAMPAHPSHVVSILLPNVICMICHLFMTLPTGTESSRGYLHGGILIDFIGQTPPTSRLYLLALDACILSLQCLMLAVHSQREALRETVKPQRGFDFLPELRRQIRAQALDEEDRGRRRNAREAELGDNNDIEMGLLGGDGPSNADRQEETTWLRGGGPPSSTATKRQLADIYASGNAVIGDFHLLQTIRLASTDYSAAAAHSIRTLGYTATLATILARERRNQSDRRSG
ncbi:uncharacterized protein DNG_03596 [Cephalotrichum gorgonifer]|uniref:DUF1746 domain-containing protein n=1 Tax=Cephalotrichum gorgonifer TaxID=2041049 RepID=A0AAE8MX39_9PEZI|nr:uncharacterized protein DNG_03596 [Cephalotrichum gorgonifer]